MQSKEKPQMAVILSEAGLIFEILVLSPPDQGA